MPDTARRYTEAGSFGIKVEDATQTALNEIMLYQECRDRYADLLRDEMRMETERPLVKHAAILRLMGQPNPLTTTPDKVKQHSASSAEAIVEMDEEYRAHLLNQRNIVHSKNRAYTEAESAFFRATLSLAQLKVAAGVG